MSEDYPKDEVVHVPDNMEEEEVPATHKDTKGQEEPAPAARPTDILTEACCDCEGFW